MNHFLVQNQELTSHIKTLKLALGLAQSQLKHSKDNQNAKTIQRLAYFMNWSSSSSLIAYLCQQRVEFLEPHYENIHNVFLLSINNWVLYGYIFNHSNHLVNYEIILKKISVSKTREFILHQKYKAKSIGEIPIYDFGPWKSQIGMPKNGQLSEPHILFSFISKLFRKQKL